MQDEHCKVAVVGRIIVGRQWNGTQVFAMVSKWALDRQLIHIPV